MDILVGEEMIFACVDGGSRGNPGEMYGSWSVDDKIEWEEYGQGTNNIAEYKAMISLLTYLSRNYPDADLTIISDSKLVVEQYYGRWKVAKEHLVPLHQQVYDLLHYHPTWKLEWTRREIVMPILGH